MAMNDLDYCEAHGLCRNGPNLAFVSRVRCAGAWIRNKAYARYLKSERTAQDQCAWSNTITTSHKWETRQVARRRILANGKQELPTATQQERTRQTIALRLSSPMRPSDCRNVAPPCELELFAFAQEPALI